MSLQVDQLQYIKLNQVIQEREVQPKLVDIPSSKLEKSPYKSLTKFSEHLEGDYVSHWEMIIAEIEKEEVNEYSFSTTIEVLKEEYFNEKDYELQMDYLRELCKPEDVSPKCFLQLLQTQNSLGKELPGCPSADSGLS